MRKEIRYYYEGKKLKYRIIEHNEIINIEKKVFNKDIPEIKEKPIFIDTNQLILIGLI